MATIIKFDRYFDDQDTSGHAETKFNSIQQIAILHLKLVLAVHRRALICYRERTTKITSKNRVLWILAIQVRRLASARTPVSILAIHTYRIQRADLQSHMYYTYYKLYRITYTY